MTRDGFSSLPEAVEWARSRWDERPTPLRLHDGETDGALGGLRYSTSFSRHLNARPNDTITAAMTESCYHPLVRIGTSLFDCPDCWGVGVKTATRDRFRYPTWRAMNRILHKKPVRPGLPAPAALVVALAGTDWDGRAAARALGLAWELAEALFLMALRQLHNEYQEGPTGKRVPWTQLSESQQRAQEAVA